MIFFKLFYLPNILFCILIRFYQKFISPLFLRRCCYYPTCSMYAYQALKKYFFVKAFFLVLRRLLSCHSLGSGGYDPLK